MRPAVLWLTGLPGSGKSTISEALRGCIKGSVILRVDEIRQHLTPNPTYSEHEREMVYRALVYTALKLYEMGHVVIIDATANRRRWRDYARSVIDNFVEVYIQCDLEVCIYREHQRPQRHGAPAEIYKKAKEGYPVPGVNVPYEEPLSPEIVINTERVTPDEALKLICAIPQLNPHQFVSLSYEI
jgi:adenylylsulfate kinase